MAVQNRWSVMEGGRKDRFTVLANFGPNSKPIVQDETRLISTV